MDNLTPVKISALPAVASPSTSSKVPLVDSDNITKYATIADLLALFSSGSSWTANALPAVSSVTALGNRSYNITFASTVAAILTPGMRLRTSRTVAAPGQCTDLEAGSSQYYSKTTPAGMTFTDDFTVSAWVKMESYANMTISSRYNNTSGWTWVILAGGALQLAGFNAGAGNVSYVQSYQSVPLNRWVHVASQLDMSGFSVSATVSYVMIDGVDVDAFVARAGTNPTALIQAGNLEIGGQNGGGLPFDGKLSQVAIYSAKVTIATILASIDRTLSGSETSLASAYSFSNSIADLNTTNANNLTANNSAVATNVDSPFSLDANGVPGGTYDFGIVTKVSTTVATVQVPEGCTIPTTGGVSTVDLSPYKAPFGFPSDSGRWTVVFQSAVDTAQATPTSGTWYNAGLQRLLVPIGDWDLGYSGTMFITTTATQTLVRIKSTLSTTSSSESDIRFGAYGGFSGASGTLTSAIPIANTQPLSLSAATTYYLNLLTNQANGSTMFWNGSNRPTMITAKCALL